jgi:hypothetical protein
MNANRRLSVKVHIYHGLTPKEAYEATKGIKGNRKPLAKSSIWQKLKSVKNTLEQAKEETPNENPTDT